MTDKEFSNSRQEIELREEQAVRLMRAYEKVSKWIGPMALIRVAEARGITRTDRTIANLSLLADNERVDTEEEARKRFFPEMSELELIGLMGLAQIQDEVLRRSARGGEVGKLAVKQIAKLINPRQNQG